MRAEATPLSLPAHKETMLKRIPLVILLALQTLGSGAITLAHARDVVVAPPGIEARHSQGCRILHDELRCALCHYAGTRVVTQQTLTVPVPARGVRVSFVAPVFQARSVVHHTAPARAPPAALS